MIFTAAILFIAAFGFSAAVSAAETRELFVLDNTYNIAVSIRFDAETPVVSFTSPSGNVITGASLRFDNGDGWIQYYIPNAEPGEWQITYDMRTNTEFEINYSSYMDSIDITEFALKDIDGTDLPVVFTVSSIASGTYQYEIYAVVTDSHEIVTGEMLIAEGTAVLNESFNENIYIGSLANYENYRLRLDVWQVYGVEEVYDSAVTNETFAVLGNAVNDAVEDFYTEIHLTEGMVVIDWADWVLQGADYTAAIFDKSVNETEPLYFIEIEHTENETTADLLFDPEITDFLTVELSYRLNGILSETRTKTIQIHEGIKIFSDTDGLTNSSQILLYYETDKNIFVSFSVNGRKDTVNLDGTGSFSINLDTGYNEIEIRYNSDDPNTVYILNFDTVVFNTPPALRLPEHKTPVYTDSSEFVLAGVTDPGATITAAGEMVDINTDGTFNWLINLNTGENIIKITAADPAGNITEHDIIIYLNDNILSETGAGTLWETIWKFLPFITAAAGLAAAVIIVLIVVRGLSKTLNKGLYILKAIRSIIIPATVICAGIGGYCLWEYTTYKKLSGSVDFFALAAENIDNVYELLKNIELYGSWLKHSGIAAASGILLIITTSLIIKAANKNKTDKEKTEL